MEIIRWFISIAILVTLIIVMPVYFLIHDPGFLVRLVPIIIGMAIGWYRGWLDWFLPWHLQRYGKDRWVPVKGTGNERGSDNQNDPNSGRPSERQ